MSQLTPQPGILKIAPYQSGKSQLAGCASVLKLSSNENPLGPPPSAISAASRAMTSAHIYPPTDQSSLKQAIAEVWNLDPGRIVCGVGSDEVLQFVTQAFAGPGDEILYTEHGFSMYPILCHMAGASPVAVPEKIRVVDVDAIIAALTPRTKVILIANPGNPTGTMIPEGEVQRLADAIPENVILVLDGAYTEYAQGYDGGAELAHTRENVLMTRTFSKIYGLGGLRIGWGYGGKTMVEIMERLRQPFNLSCVQLSAAEAAVRDTAWRDRCAALNTEQRERLIGALRALDIECDHARGNFVLARFADADEAGRADEALQAAGILVRRVAGYGFPEALRITVGDGPQNRRVLETLTQWREVDPCR